MKQPAYGHDLAFVHDDGFDFYARGCAPGVLALFKRHGLEDGLVVDLGCGSGIWAAELLGAGYEVLGIDISADMIKLAKKKAPGARFRRQSVLDVELPPCKAVTAMGEVFNYLFDERAGKPALLALFQRVWKALSPGGLFVFDVATPGRSRASGQRRGCWEGDDWLITVQVEEDDRQHILTRRITTFHREGKLYRRSDEIHRLKLYQPAKLAGELRRLGFRVRTSGRHGDFELPQGITALIARKPK